MKYELEGNVKKYYDYCKSLKMNDEDAIILSKFSSQMLEHTKSVENWTKEKYVNVACNVLVNEANIANMERKILINQRELLKKHRMPLAVQKVKIEKSADVYAHKKIWQMFSIIMAQYFMSQYGTYVVFSWDILEPITCAMTLGDAIVAYFFWMWTKTAYCMGNIREHYFLKKKKKLSKKFGYNEEQHNKINRATQILKQRIAELK